MTAELTLRSEKGAPLTNQEVDDNFQNLSDAIDEVSANIEGVAADAALVLAIALG